MRRAARNPPWVVIPPAGVAPDNTGFPVNFMQVWFVLGRAGGENAILKSIRLRSTLVLGRVAGAVGLSRATRTAHSNREGCLAKGAER